MAPFLIPPQILIKIQQAHRVEEDEVREAFFNRDAPMCDETREKHEREYKKLWFISKTDEERVLKVVIAELKEDDQLVLISAYEPSEEDIQKYENKKTDFRTNRKRQ